LSLLKCSKTQKHSRAMYMHTSLIFIAAGGNQLISCTYEVCTTYFTDRSVSPSLGAPPTSSGATAASASQASCSAPAPSSARTPPTRWDAEVRLVFRVATLFESKIYRVLWSNSCMRMSLEGKGRLFYCVRIYTEWLLLLPSC
jgi:hypothetical protein